jgi:hypothetical protein
MFLCLTDSVMSSGIVVSGILLSGNHLFRVEELTVSSGSEYKNDRTHNVYTYKIYS